MAIIKHRKLARQLPGALLVLSLAGSLASTYYGFRMARKHYGEIQKVRQDPLGLRNSHFKPGPEQPVIAFYGDSRAAGWPEPPGLAGRTVNRGISAQTTEQMVERFDRSLAQISPHFILIQAGINDLKSIPLLPDQEARIMDRCKENLSALVARSKARCETVVVSTIIPPGDIEWMRRPVWSERVDPAIAGVNNHIRSLASDRVIVFDAAAIVSDPDNRLRIDYQKDFLHLSAAGYAALNISLMELLGQRTPMK